MSEQGSNLAGAAATPLGVNRLVQQFSELWWASDTSLPPLGRTYSSAEQATCEAEFERFQGVVNAAGKRPPRSATAREATKERILDGFRVFARRALGFEERHLEALLDGGMPDVGMQFAQMARRFDQKVRTSDIFQAMRNLWTMNGIQSLLGLPISVTPAMFAYSMLYPYTDNYLDDPAIAAEAKRAFNERFGRRLAGEDVAPADPAERRIYELVGQIEGDYSRGRYPQVFDSLMAIHNAQCRSVELLRRQASPYEVDVLGISVEKGGTSVLADGYLVAPGLNQAQAEYVFGWGAFVQFVDDVQDVAEDAGDGLATVFSATAGRWPLDAVTNRALNFGRAVVQRLSAFPSAAAAPMQDMMRVSAVRLLMESAGHAREYYTPAYIEELERHSPFRFAFLAQRRGAFAGQSAPLLGLVEAYARTLG